jgi:hypothetical protein
MVKTEKELPKIKGTRLKKGVKRAIQSFFDEEAEEVNEEEDLKDEVKT